MTQIVKKNKTTEEFSEDKLRNSIEYASDEAGVEEKRKKEVVDKVSRVIVEMTRKQKEIKSTDLRKRILSELDRMEPSVSEHWRTYDETKKQGD